MNRLKRKAASDISERIIAQLEGFANNTTAADNYYDRLNEMLRQEVSRVAPNELENLADSVTNAIDVVNNLQYALGLIEKALQRAEDDISDKR